MPCFSLVKNMKRIIVNLFRKRILLLILILGGVLRIGMLFFNIQDNYSLFHNNTELISKKINADDKPFQHSFGSEISNVAYSIVCKRDGFSNPFGGHTGPTGWVAPGMVAIYALSFYWFGCFTFKSIIFVFLFSLAVSLLMILLVYLLCIELFRNEIIGYIGAFLLAIDFHDIFIFKRINQQDFNTLPFLFLLVFYLFMRCIKSRSIKNLLLVTLASGTAILFNPAFGISIFLLLFFLLKRTIFKLKHGMIFLIVTLLMVTPYILYQRHQLEIWSLVKSNGPFEIYQGNVPDFSGFLTIDLFKKYHPIMNQKEYREYKVKGEREYIDSKFAQFKNKFDLGSFALLSIKKILYFFFIFPPLKIREPGVTLLMNFAYSLRGLSLLIYLLIRVKSITMNDKLLFIYIISFSIPYCVVGIMYRYSFPIVPLTTVLAAYSVYTICGWIKSNTVQNSWHC